MVEANPDDPLLVAVEGHASTTVSGEGVVLNLKTGRYSGMNDVAARIWDLLQVPVRVSDIRRQLDAEYEVSSDILEADLVDFLEALVDAELIVVCDEQPKK